MSQATYSVDIDRSVSSVFEFISDGENSSKWRSEVLDVKHVSGEGVGSTYAQGVSGVGGRRVPADYRITVFEPNKRIEFQTTEGAVRPHGRYEFATLGFGTRLSYSLDAEAKGFKSILLRRGLQKRMTTQVRELDHVKRVLER